ncbi:DUF3307 domain-containing protein [candidate division KSB1 bacterium]|nr:DUF3307 domain-containing protein [candidate division KSB1 bacterium]
MDFFQILLLAHIIGDFPLQTDAIYRLKQKSYWGVILHVAVCTIVNIIMLFQFLTSYATWIAILFLALFHFALDRTKILLTVFKAKDGLRYFFIDQAFHILSLYIAALWLQRMYQGLTLPSSNIDLIIILNALFAAAFAVPPILYYTQKKIKKWYRLQSNFEFPAAYERLPGSLARFLGTLGLLLGGWYALLLLLPVIVPYIAPQNRSRGRVYRNSESVINVLGCLVGALYVHLV